MSTSLALEAVSLDQIICQRRPAVCSNERQYLVKHFLSDGPRHRQTDFRSWKEYGSGWNDGSGMGIGAGPNYGPGRLVWENFSSSKI